VTRERDNFCIDLPAVGNREKVRTPGVEGGAFLRSPIVPLVYADNPCSASAEMIQHRLSDFEAHAEALQPCREGTAQVMQAPAAARSTAQITRAARRVAMRARFA
jgi:hypothetical protein